MVKEARDMLEFTESTIEVERRVARKCTVYTMYNVYCIL